MNDKEKLQQLLSDYKRLEKENAYLKQLNARLMRNAASAGYASADLNETESPSPKVTNSEYISSHALPEEKISLFRSLFRGRDDVFALQWESKKDVSVILRHANMNGSAPFAGNRK